MENEPNIKRDECEFYRLLFQDLTEIELSYQALLVEALVSKSENLEVNLKDLNQE